jgi:anti-sigma regulatory factor (Ser/Thr protein kinase)
VSSTDPLIATVAVPADPAYLTICRHALAGAAINMDMADADLDDLKLMLSEACSNAIVHGYQGQGHGLIEIELRTPPGEMEVTVMDRGRGFRDGEVPEQPGLGLSLLQRLSSRYRIDPARPGGGASVTFARSVTHY